MSFLGEGVGSPTLTLHNHPQPPTLKARRPPHAQSTPTPSPIFRWLGTGCWLPYPKKGLKTNLRGGDSVGDVIVMRRGCGGYGVGVQRIELGGNQIRLPAVTGWGGFAPPTWQAKKLGADPSQASSEFKISAISISAFPIKLGRTTRKIFSPGTCGS